MTSDIVQWPGVPRQSDARDRMIRSAAALFRERGVEGTSFSDVLEHSGAPRGSIYHHFRGGKPQLAEEATRWAGELVMAGIVAALREDDPVGAVAAFAGQWSRALRDSDFAAGCPIVAAALEGDRSPAVRDAAGRAFRSWEDALAGAFRSRGVAPERARSVATLVIAAVEGAIVLARAQRSIRPLERVTGELQAVVTLALEPASP